MDVLTIVGALIAVIAGSVSTAIAIKGVFQRYTRAVFADDVFTALDGQAARYREFHYKVFASELERGRRTADLAAGLVRDVAEVQKDVLGHREEFGHFRIQYDGHHEQLVLFPKMVVHLDETIKRLDGTLKELNITVGHVREDVAHLKARVS